MKLKVIAFITPFFALAFLSGCASNAARDSGSTTISGKAFYLQRIAMPPEAVLSVRVEDVSLADLKSPMLAELNEPFGDRQVPIKFSLQVPNSAIVGDNRYNIRATIGVNGQQHFSTLQNYPVLTHGAKNEVELVLEAVRPNAAVNTELAVPSPDQLKMAVPATYKGILPCADCPGIEHTLTLRGDGLYRMRRIYQEKPDGSYSEMGRWQAEGELLTLTNGSETNLFEITDAQTIKQLDGTGEPIATTSNLDLRRIAEVDPINDSMKWRGEFRYMADAASFIDCASGLRWPVATAGDYLATERHYIKTRKIPGSSLVINIKGKLETRPNMEGTPVEQMVIEKFNGSKTGVSCASLVSGKAKHKVELTDTFWKLVDLEGKKIPIARSHKQQIRIVMASEGSRVMGYSGCNRVMGTYVKKANALHFSQLAGSMMACASQFMGLEQQVLKMLHDTTTYRIEGKDLFLLKDNQILGQFEAQFLQ